MDTLARQGVVYANAIASAPWTLPSTVSIFTGKLPTEHGITGDALYRGEGDPRSPSDAVMAYPGQWLTSELSQLGYRTLGISCNPWVGSWGGFDRGFDRFGDIRPWQRKPRKRIARLIRRAKQMHLLKGPDHGGQAAIAQLARWLDDGPPTMPTSPWFTYVNLMEAHAPYDPPLRFHPSIARVDGAESSAGRARIPRYQSRQVKFRETPEPKYLAALRLLYEASARYQDRLVGLILETCLREDRPLAVAVVADHGENLGEHGLFSHNSSLHETLLHVPLVLWSSRGDLSPDRIEEPTSTLGLLNWFLATAERSVPGELWRTDSPVVSEYESTDRHTPIPAELRARLARQDPSVPSLVYAPGVAVRIGSLKYVWVDNGQEALYDLASDPGEERNLAVAGEADLAPFRRLRDEWRTRRHQQPSYEVGETAEEEIADQLRALGYIE